MRSPGIRPLLLGLALQSVLSGCRAYPPAASPPAAISEDWATRASQRWRDASETELGVGRQVFVEQCAECHRHPDVTYLPEDEWPTTVRRMGKYAKLDDAQSRAVLRFILTARAEVFGHAAAFEETERPIELRPTVPQPPLGNEGIRIPSSPPSAP